MKLKDIISKVFAVDKVAHFGVCFAITVILSAFINKPLGPVVGMLVAFALGLGKEIYDKVRGGKFELGDLVADFLGLAIAGICVTILMKLHLTLW